MSTTKKTPKRKSSSPKKKKNEDVNFRLMERRRHPRFLLSNELFRDIKTGKVFSVFDLSQTGLSIRVDEKIWPEGSLVQGILNLHPDSIELTVRALEYHGDRLALQIEALTTYSRSVLSRALSPKRLGTTLKLVKEKLPLADMWFHGACSTDVLIRFKNEKEVSKIEVFFSNYYWCWSDHSQSMATGVCQSFGKDARGNQLLSEEPVFIESLDLSIDAKPNEEKVSWAKGILDSAPMDNKLKSALLKKFDPA